MSLVNKLGYIAAGFALGITGCSVSSTQQSEINYNQQSQDLFKQISQNNPDAFKRFMHHEILDKRVSDTGVDLAKLVVRLSSPFENIRPQTTYVVFNSLNLGLNILTTGPSSVKYEILDHVREIPEEGSAEALTREKIKYLVEMGEEAGVRTLDSIQRYRLEGILDDETYPLLLADQFLIGIGHAARRASDEIERGKYQDIVINIKTVKFNFTTRTIEFINEDEEQELEEKLKEYQGHIILKKHIDETISKYQQLLELYRQRIEEFRQTPQPTDRLIALLHSRGSEMDYRDLNILRREALRKGFRVIVPLYGEELRMIDAWRYAIDKTSTFMKLNGYTEVYPIGHGCGGIGGKCLAQSFQSKKAVMVSCPIDGIRREESDSLSKQRFLESIFGKRYKELLAGSELIEAMQYIPRNVQFLNIRTRRFSPPSSTYYFLGEECMTASDQQDWNQDDTEKTYDLTPGDVIKDGRVITEILQFISLPKAPALLSSNALAAPANCPPEVWAIHTRLKKELESSNPDLEYFSQVGHGRWAEPFTRRQNPETRRLILEQFNKLRSQRISEEFYQVENKGNEIILKTKLKYQKNNQVNERIHAYRFQMINGRWYCTRWF